VVLGATIFTMSSVLRVSFAGGRPLPMVVRGQGQRPGSEQAIVISKELRCRLGRSERVHSIIDGRCRCACSVDLSSA